MSTNKQPFEPQTIPIALTGELAKGDWRALVRFNATSQDGQNYDVSSEAMKRLARIGLVQHRGSSRYQITDLGELLLNQVGLHSIARITFTGVDALTKNEDLIEVSKKARQSGLLVEWGLLFSKDRAGQPGRYGTALAIAQRLQDLGNLNLAIHFCGKAVDDVLNQADSEALCLLQAAQLHGNCRVQLNFNNQVKKFTPEHIGHLMESFPSIDFILQANANNSGFIRELSSRAFGQAPAALAQLARLQVLFDASGGKGIEPSSWPDPTDGQGFVVGYAGGLGPENIVSQMRSIESLKPPFKAWVDMEGRLREQDIFAVAKCQAVIDSIREYRIY